MNRCEMCGMFSCDCAELEQREREAEIADDDAEARVEFPKQPIADIGEPNF